MSWIPPIGKARYIMVGGFLGSGKTTSIARLAQRLVAGGQRVGLITNDQGSDLVDTAMLRARGFATEEIAGGCFCCRFNSLLEAADKLTGTSHPDVFIAEPVGSCTDLVATVTYPLRRMYGDRFTIAPLNVLVDPIRANRVLDLASGGSFSTKVLYVYRKQLEEADLIIINKTDLLDVAGLTALERALNSEYPQARVLKVSARTGTGLDDWFDQLDAQEHRPSGIMDVDYEIYGDGEALLGWLNSTLQVSAETSFDGNAVVKALANQLRDRLRGANIEVAHLKMTLSPDAGLDQIAVINLVRNDFIPELSQELIDEIESAQLILNLRAEAAPERLQALVSDSLVAAAAKFTGLTIRSDHQESFRPGKPQPTHRMSRASL